MERLSAILTFLRRPIATFADRVAELEDRVVAAERRAVQEADAQLGKLTREAALGIVAVLLGVIGGIYLLIGIWLGSSRILGSIGASFVLGTLFVLVSLAPLAMLRVMRRKPADDGQRRPDVE